jgi:hypothetical protein
MIKIIHTVALLSIILSRFLVQCKWDLIWFDEFNSIHLNQVGVSSFVTNDGKLIDELN